MSNKKIDLSTLRQLGFATNLPIDTTSNLGASGPVSDSTNGNPITNSFYGINLLQTPLPVPINKDHHGFFFVTRPQLNFQSRNLKNRSFFYPLLTQEAMSVHRYIRCTLDPRLQLFKESGINHEENGEDLGVSCPLVDPYNVFIPLLSNHIVSVSGFPDKVAPVYQTQEGQYMESHSQIDGTIAMYGQFNISATFRNARGNPIARMMDYWVTYGTEVFEGLLAPYADYMIANVYDYMTRLYRVTLDPSKQKVQGIAATGASYPINVPTAQQFDMNIDRPYNDANAQLNINFQTNGIMINEEHLIWDFNRAVGCFHPFMWATKERETNMIKVPYNKIAAFNCRAYPRINAVTRDLEWWVAKSYFEEIMDQATKSIEEIMDMTVTPREEIIQNAINPQSKPTQVIA